MRITEYGHGRVRLDLDEAFTSQDARAFLRFMHACPYTDDIRLLVIPGASTSWLSEAEAIEYGRTLSAILSGGSGRIAVVYDPGSERQVLEYTLIDTTISLHHRLIAQFRDEDEARSWLDWNLVTVDGSETD